MKKTYDAIVAEARALIELEASADALLDELDEDDAVTGGPYFSDNGDYASAVSDLD